MKTKKTQSSARSARSAIGYALLGAGIAVLFFALLLLALPGVSPGAGDASVPGSIVEFEAEQTPPSSESSGSGITIPGFEVWNVAADSTAVASRFYNPEGNSCCFVITVTLDDTGETIYESKYLKPGQYLYEVELLRPLPAGSYEATIHYSTFSPDGSQPLNAADVPFLMVAA